MEKEMFELNEQNLDEVAGGKIVETKDGEFLVLPKHVKGFKTREEAEKVQEKFSKKCNCKHSHPHMHPHHEPKI